MGRRPVPSQLLTSTGQHQDLYVQPEVVTFSHRQAEDLSSHLRQMDTGTSVYPVSDATEFQLDEEGRTRVGGYRFTSSAFFQTAQIVAPGLSRFLPDLSGSIPLPDEYADLVDGRLAISLWNELVDLRFPRFRFHRVIRNEDGKTIEGLMGSKHQYLENLALYQYANEAMQNHQPSVRMYAAQLIGRRLALWFRNQTPMFSIQVGEEAWPVYYGYYFTNGEATGTSVRGTLAIFTRKGICLGPYKRRGGRVTHTGKDFFQRLGKMFTGVTSAEVPEEAIREGAESLLTKSLGFTVEMDRQGRRDQTKMLVHTLSHLGVPQNLAAEVVEEGLTVGRSLGQANFRPMEQVDRLYASRTTIDLFVPLLGLAKKLDLSRREKLEQAAFEILTDRFLV